MDGMEVQNTSPLTSLIRVFRSELLRGSSSGKTNLQLPEEVKHGHAHHDDHKGSQRGDHVHGRHAAPLLEEDDGGGQNHGGEEDVVDGVDEQGVEGVQRLVQVIHL